MIFILAAIMVNNTFECEQELVVCYIYMEATKLKLNDRNLFTFLFKIKILLFRFFLSLLSFSTFGRSKTHLYRVRRYIFFRLIVWNRRLTRETCSLASTCCRLPARLQSTFYFYCEFYLSGISNLCVAVGSFAVFPLITQIYTLERTLLLKINCCRLLKKKKN